MDSKKSYVEVYSGAHKDLLEWAKRALSENIAIFTTFLIETFSGKLIYIE